MPGLLKLQGVVGTAALIRVVGGLLVYGSESDGLSGSARAIHAAATHVATQRPAAGGVLEWPVTATAAGCVDLGVGAALIPAAGFVPAPARQRLARSRHPAP